MSLKNKSVSRRSFNSGFLSLLSIPFASCLLPSALQAGETELWEKRVKSIVQDIKPVEGKVTIEMPALASHQNLVPIVISVVSPMTADDYVESITLISNRTSEPVLAEFEFTPSSGKAEVSTSLRLRKNQQIMALAKTNKGDFFLGRRQAQVNINRSF